MSATITVDEAQAKLTELIGRLGAGKEIVITQNHEPVAKLVGQRPSGRKPRVPGNCKGMITLALEDDEHLKDFKEYMDVRRDFAAASQGPLRSLADRSGTA
jgi:prevent-host-death family protein